MFDRVLVHPRGALRLARMRARGGPESVVIDVDGCLTDGQIYQSVDGSLGKLFKVFGPDDHDALRDIAERLEVRIVSADRVGYELTRRRISHMGFTVEQRTPAARLPTEMDLDSARSIYIGDGYHDLAVMRAYGFGIAPYDAWPVTRRGADAVTSRPGGARAVAQALDFVLRWMVRN